MIDIDTGRIIDMIESREKDEVMKWLAAYPCIKVVSRDGSQQYATAIRQAHPNAIQVSDRFHLVKNLTDNAKQHISKIITASFRIRAEEGNCGVSGGYWDKAGFDRANLPERAHVSKTEKKRALVGKVHTLAAKGFSISEIERELGITGPTIRKYINVDFNPAHKDFGSKRDSKIKPFTSKIDAMLIDKCKFAEIEAVIRADGYDGVISTIRMYATRQRRIINDTKFQALGKTELIERKWVMKLLYQPIEKVKGITESQVERVVNEYPVIGILYDIVCSFKEIMFTKRVEDLDAWIETVTQYGIDEINSFISGINSDLDAVKNAIRYDYNNGLAEGSINKLKVIKRIMYGRCSFRLLRNKILHREFL